MHMHGSMTVAFAFCLHTGGTSQTSGVTFKACSRNTLQVNRLKKKRLA